MVREDGKRTHDGGVESRRREAGSAHEVLGGAELVLVGLLGLEGAVTVRGAVVEALEGGGGHGGDGGREGEEGGCSTHVGARQAEEVDDDDDVDGEVDTQLYGYICKADDIKRM